MKKLIFFLALLIGTQESFAGKITATSNKGKWRNANSWDLNRTPRAGDTIIIPAGRKVELDNLQDLTATSTFLEISGELILKSKGILKLHASSRIQVMGGGVISSHNNSDDDDYISIGGVRKFEGEEADITGAAYANSSTGVTPNGFNYGVLPVKLVSFTARRNLKEVELNWVTAQEKNSSRFEVQRRKGNSSWRTINTVQAAGNSDAQKSYNVRDEQAPSSACFYRLKQVDMDGSFTYSETRVVKAVRTEPAINITSTNTGGINVDFGRGITGRVTVSLFTINGQMLSRNQVNNPAGIYQVPVTGLGKGTYFVRVKYGKNQFVSNQVIL